MIARPLLMLIRCELLKLWRAPAFAIPTLLFPAFFFALFGLPQLGRTIQGAPAGLYLIASYAAFAVMSVGLFSFGVSVAAERAQGWSRLLQATPLRPGIHLLARLIVALVFGAASIGTLCAFAAAAGGLRLPAAFLGGLLLQVLPGVVPFCALGLALGHLASAGAAAAIANVVFLPLAFASGLFVPLELLPALVGRIAPWLPSYHLGVLGWSLVQPVEGPAVARSVLALSVFTALLVLLALWAWRRDHVREYD